MFMYCLLQQKKLVNFDWLCFHSSNSKSNINELSFAGNYFKIQPIPL